MNIFVEQDFEQYDNEWPPQDATVFLAWFSKKLSDIPAEFRASATIKIDSVSSYENSHYASITIKYTRPETESEFTSRERNEANKQHYKRQQELAQLAKLKAKYPDAAEQTKGT